jgi:hypothetical protein
MAGEHFDSLGGKKVDYTAPVDYVRTVSIAAGATGLSGEIDLEGASLMAISMPAAWTPANITFQAASALAANGGVYQDVYDDSGSEVVVTAAAAHIITVDLNALKLAALRYIKIRSGTTATPVDQTTPRTITLILKG